MSDMSGAKGIFRFFGGRKADGQFGGSYGEPSGVVGEGVRMSLTDMAGERLLEEITVFFVGNQLSVTARNLVVAYSAFSGEDPQLARRIMAHLATGEKITQGWLDAAAPVEMPDPAIEAIAEVLDQSLDRYSASTKSVRVAAAEYSKKMSMEVSEVERHLRDEKQGGLLKVAKAMLKRTQQLEADMKVREDEANQLREQLLRAQRDAEIDHLTGLPNRRAFETLLERHYREAQAEVDHLCVAFCDIDHFKKVNDTHGHDTGDRVIQAIAQSLAQLTSDKCHAARHGGEEFVLLFRGFKPQDAFVRLDGLRENFSLRRFVNRESDLPIGRITFSAGIADVFAYSNPRDALRAADQALYQAKEAGRNAVHLA